MSIGNTSILLALALLAGFIIASLLWFVGSQRRTLANRSTVSVVGAHLLGNQDVGMILLDREDLIREVNPAARKILGGNARQYFYRPLSQLTPWKEALVKRSQISSVQTQITIGAHMNPRGYELMIIPVRSRKVVEGWMLLLTDLTPYIQGGDELRRVNEQLHDLVQTLEARNEEVTLLNQMGELLQRCADKTDATKVVAYFVERLLPPISGGLYLLNESRSQAEMAVRWGKNPPEEFSFDGDDCWGVRIGRPHIVQDHTAEMGCKHTRQALLAPGVQSVCLPLIAQGEVIGVFHLRGDPSGLQKDWLQTVTTLVDHVALALANLDLRETLRKQSIRDPLTDLYNRRYMEEFLDSELKRAQRGNYPVGVIMLDIDHFKRYNDTFGHAAGDMVLVELSQYLRSNLRGEDVVCRYGGEEFIVILPGATLEDTIRRSEYLRQGTCSMRTIQSGKPLGGITMSLGVASSQRHGATREELLRSVDTALYQAKHLGRNRVVIAEPPAVYTEPALLIGK